jgi:N-acetylglucosamine kinase-like BadF-type ATPase
MNVPSFPKPADVLIAVDGGGTKTQALATDLEGKVLGRGLGPGCNMHRVGFKGCTDAVQTAVDGALQHLVGPRGRGDQPAWHAVPVAAACFGLSGIDSPADEQRFTEWLVKQRMTTRFRVFNDSELILAAGTPDGWGVALISGTGSVCLGRTRDGRSVRVGGWGHLLGDEGSGFRIAQDALRYATHTADGRANAKQILNAALRHFGVNEPHELIQAIYGGAIPHSEIAALAATVVNLSQAGDAPSRLILEGAAQDLALHVDTVVQKLGMKRPHLAFGGGVLRTHFRALVQSAIKSELAGVQYVSDPSSGAVTLARKLYASGGPH